MYSSNSNNPISSSYSDQPFFQRPFLNDITSSTSSKQADPSPLSFFPFPSPFEDDDVFLQQLLHPQSLTETEANMVESNKNHISGQTVQLAQQIPRKRCSKRDRHSKINTARGPRDRRMRLSLEVARKFFGLQDMLGYDKASKTVEWLLVQAKAEIKKLAREMKRTTCSASSTSDQSCEVVSGVDDQVAIYYNGNHHQQQPGRSVSQEKPSKEKKMIRQWRKCAFHPLARESREKARERARERTREKMRNRRGVDESKLCDLSPFETTGEESGTQSQSMKPSSWEVRPEINEQASSHVLNDDSLVIIGTWSPSVIFSSLNNTGISQEHQLADFQFFGKPWEA